MTDEAGLARATAAVARTRAAGTDIGPAAASSLRSYLRDLRNHPMLSREDEHDLAVRYTRTRDLDLARRLVTANLRLVVKIAQEYRRAHRNLLDLIQEGNLGLIQAVNRYDPYRGVKLSTYAAWWIRAYILKFILANWRIVKLGTTQAQRRLFFNLRRERSRLERQGGEVDAKQLAVVLDVNESDVVEMERRLAWSETSLDAPARAGEEGSRTAGDSVAGEPDERPDQRVEHGEFQEVLRTKLETFGAALRGRERDIFDRRLLAEHAATLEQIGSEHGVSRERTRQVEERLKKRLRRFLEAEMGDSMVEVAGRRVVGSPGAAPDAGAAPLNADASEGAGPAPRRTRAVAGRRRVPQSPPR